MNYDYIPISFWVYQHYCSLTYYRYASCNLADQVSFVSSARMVADLADRFLLLPFIFIFFFSSQMDFGGPLQYGPIYAAQHGQQSSSRKRR